MLVSFINGDPRQPIVIGGLWSGSAAVPETLGGSGAALAGLKPGATEAVVAGESYKLGGDVITRVDGVATGSLERLRAVLARHKPGDKVGIEAYRGTKCLTLTLTLGRQPSS